MNVVDASIRDSIRCRIDSYERRGALQSERIASAKDAGSYCHGTSGEHDLQQVTRIVKPKDGAFKKPATPGDAEAAVTQR